MKTLSGRSSVARLAGAVFMTFLVGVLLIAAGCSVLGGRSDETATSTPGYDSGGVAVEPSKAPSQYGSGVSPTPDVGVTSPEEAATDSAARTGAPLTAAEQLMIRSANMRIQVKDVDDSVTRLRALTKEFDGLVENLQVSSEEQIPIYRPVDASGVSDATPLAAYATVRVPQGRFDAFLTRVTALGKVLVQSESGQDVTQQHIDLSARLKTLQAEELRLREFLDSAKTVQDMLAVERELSRVRSEIESLQGQLDYLDKQIAMSALTVELVRPTPVVQPAGTDWGFTDALRNGIRGAVAVLTGMITILISLLPLIILFTLIVMVWIAIARSRRRRRAAAASDAEDTTAADVEDEEPVEDATVSEQTHE